MDFGPFFGRSTDLTIMETKDQFLRHSVLVISSILSFFGLKGLLSLIPPFEFTVHHLNISDLVLIKT